jgi:hypothetical protein
MFRRLAADMRVPCVIVACRAEPATLTARLSERARARNDASDATLSILDAQLRSNHALEPSEERCAILVDTTGTDAAAFSVAMTAVAVVRSPISAGLAWVRSSIVTVVWSTHDFPRVLDRAGFKRSVNRRRRMNDHAHMSRCSRH